MPLLWCLRFSLKSVFRFLPSAMHRIRHRAAFRCYARRRDLAGSFKPGHYVLEPGMSVIEVARMFKLGLQTPVRISINNVRTPEQLARKLARQLDADSTSILRLLETLSGRS